MKITELALSGVKIIEPTYFEDYRGYYCETYSKRTLTEYGINDEFVQDNHSMTLKKGTLRGIHFQNNPVPQIKLVRCTKGAIKDVVVDLRHNSSTFKQWLAVELSAENRRQIWIPSGYGHAFLTLQDNCEVQYKVMSRNLIELLPGMIQKLRLTGELITRLYLKKICRLLHLRKAM